MGDMRRILLTISRDSRLCWRNGSYLEEGRGSAICFVGFVPEDIYCFPSVVLGAMLLVPADVTRNRCPFCTRFGGLVEVTMFRECT